MKLLDIDYRFLLAFGAKQREVFKYSFGAHFDPSLVVADWA